MAEHPERKESLWSLARAPLIWAVHFMLCYLTAAVFCAKLGGPEGSLSPARIAIGVYTALALALLSVTTARGLRRSGGLRSRRGEDTAADRHAFMGYMEVLLSLLSIVAVVLSALPALLIATCR